MNPIRTCLRLGAMALLLGLLPTPTPAHHCGADQPLPEFPRHSCRTRTQTIQPGERVDGHPGGSPGRGSSATQGRAPGQSVHCQLELDGSCQCGPRQGTGRNIPCRPQAVAKPAPVTESCPIRVSVYALPGLVRVRSPRPGAGLWVAGAKVESATAVGLERLTKRRKEIFDAMRCHESRGFRFANRQRLADTIDLRGKIIEKMEARYQPSNPNPQPSFACALNPPPTFETYPEPRASLIDAGAQVAARSREGTKAHDAVRMGRNAPSSLDCHAGMQWVLLDAAAELLRRERFDTVHPLREWPQVDGSRTGPGRHALVGLGVPVIADSTEFVRGQPVKSTVRSNARFTSLAKHLEIIRYDQTGRQTPRSPEEVALAALKGEIRIEDMVGGDYAYLRNVVQYADEYPSGEWAGENAYYLYERRHDGAGADRRRPSQKRVVAGFGLRMFMTEDELRQSLADAFNSGRVFQVFGFRIPRLDAASPQDMRWTRLGAPILDDTALAEAGPFVR